MLADWLTSLLSVERSTIIIIASFCGIGTWVLRGQLSNPMLGFAIHPLLTALSVSIFAMMQASGLIEPMILTDQIKGIIAATIAGHGIGIAIGMVILLTMNDKAEATENDLTKRQAKLNAKGQVQRKVRRNFQESLR